MIDLEIRKATSVIASGGTILYPTDTIWGIGCNATTPAPVEKIYRIKQRTDSKSMLVLVSDEKMLSRYVRSVPAEALELVRKTDRPTTIIYPHAVHLAANLLAQDGSVGIRITSDPFCAGLVEELGYPIVSTSANLSGEPAPSSFKEIDYRVVQAVDHVVDWRQEETSAARPSRIIRLLPGGGMETIRP